MIDAILHTAPIRNSFVLFTKMHLTAVLNFSLVIGNRCTGVWECSILGFWDWKCGRNSGSQDCNPLFIWLEFTFPHLPWKNSAIHLMGTMKYIISFIYSHCFKMRNHGVSCHDILFVMKCYTWLLTIGTTATAHRAISAYHPMIRDHVWHGDSGMGGYRHHSMGGHVGVECVWCNLTFSLWQ